VSKSATLYRMVTNEHVCPYGIKSKHLLSRKGYTVEDKPLKSREESDLFKKKHGVKTTPQTFIDGKRIGGYDELKSHFGMSVDEGGTSYQPIVAVFAVTAAMAIAAVGAKPDSYSMLLSLEWFIAFSMCVLAILKLRDISSFSNTFVTYDLIARKDVRYAYFYPFAEAIAGVLMLSGTFIWFAAPLALFIGTIGAVSVIKAVYIEKRDLKCACVGGDSNVPLGSISLTENIMMVAMGIWMLIK